MKTRKVLSIVICIFCLIVSGLLLEWTWQILSEQIQDELMSQALNIASGFDPVAISALGGGDGDAGEPEYLEIVDQLNFLEVLFPNLEYLSMLRQDGDGQVYTSLDIGSVEPYGESILDTTLDLQEIFSTSTAVSEYPVKNDERSWLRAYIPVTDPFSGNSIAVLDLVMDTSEWDDSIKLDFYLPLWSIIILNLSIFGLMGFLVYLQKIRENPRMETLARYYLIVFTGLIGTCITILSVWYVSFFERDSRREIFLQLSSTKENILSTQLRDIERFSLEGLEVFFLGSDFVSRDEFAQYSEALLQNELVAAWAWIPEVTGDERITFEHSISDYDINDDGIWEVDSDGDQKSAGDREVFFPIEYIMPESKTNLGLIGYDLASSITQESKIENTLQTGRSSASIPVDIYFAADGEYIIAYRPVKKAGDKIQESGVVVAFIQIEKLFQIAQFSTINSASTVYLDFFQFTSDGEFILLLSNSPEEMQQVHMQSHLQSHHEVEFTTLQPVFAYGNTYVFVAHPGQDFNHLYPATSSIIIGISAGLLTVALMIFVNDSSGRNVILARLVGQRTEQLAASEERLRLASESVKLGVFDMITRSREVVVNDVYAEMLGYDLETFTESYESSLKRIHPEDRKKTKKEFERFMNGSIPEYKMEFRMKTASNEWIWVFSTAMVVERDEENHPLRILRSHLDITARKKAINRTIQLLDQSNSRLKQMETLREIDKAIASEYDLNRIIGLLLNEIRRQLDVDAVIIFLYDETANVFRYTGSLGLKKVRLDGMTLNRHDSLAGRAANYGRPIHAQNFNDFIDPAFIPIMAEEEIKDTVVFSLVTQGKIKGVIELWHRSVKVPDSGWMKFAETLAGQAAIAIDYSQMFTGLLDANKELRQAYNATIEGWSKAMDLKDKETEGHTQRVTQMTVDLAKRIGIEGDALDHIRRGALLHDIGKMGIPDSILLKPGLLADEELIEIQKHPLYAFEMLKSIEYLRPALDIPYLHHEKWDGSGYPLGLKEDEIPIFARLFAIIDVFDALTNDRPYRPAWTVEKTLAYIVENSGIHFDPNITPIFIDMIRGQLDH